MIHDGLWDVYNNVHMGNTGETLHKNVNHLRQDSDQIRSKSNNEQQLRGKMDGLIGRPLAIEIPQRRAMQYNFHEMKESVLVPLQNL